LVKAKNLNTLPIFTEDYITNTLLTSSKNLNNFGTEISLDLNDDAYESIKFLNYVHYLNFKNILSIDNNILNPISYTQIIDNFRADYDSPQWSVDYTNNDSNLYKNNITDPFNNELRLTNPLKLRSTARNSIVTYNAIQKVFRSRYDEGRSNARIQDLANSYENYPFITSNRVAYETILLKNKDFFYNVNTFNQYLKPNFSDIYSI